jgi:hypothetical protein
MDTRERCAPGKQVRHTRFLFPSPIATCEHSRFPKLLFSRTLLSRLFYVKTLGSITARTHHLPTNRGTTLTFHLTEMKMRSHLPCSLHLCQHITISPYLRKWLTSDEKIRVERYNKSAPSTHRVLRADVARAGHAQMVWKRLSSAIGVRAPQHHGIKVHFLLNAVASHPESMRMNAHNARVNLLKQLFRIGDSYYILVNLETCCRLS